MIARYRDDMVEILRQDLTAFLPGERTPCCALARSNVIYICSSYTCLHTGDSTTPLLSAQRVSPLRFVGINHKQKPIPLPYLGYQGKAQPKIESHFVDRLVNHMRGPGKESPPRLEIPPLTPRLQPSGLEYLAGKIPQCHEIITTYRTKISFQRATTPPLFSRETGL